MVGCGLPEDGAPLLRITSISFYNDAAATDSTVPEDNGRGIVSDGKGIRFMTDDERELYARRELPSTLIVIVPPSPFAERRK